MSNYTKGRRFEYQLMKYLRNFNPVVMRTAGSHGLFDIIAVKPGAILFIQAKCDNRRKHKEFKPIKFGDTICIKQMLASHDNTPGELFTIETLKQKWYVKE